MTRLPAACLFDLDGLLLDTEPLHGRAWAEAASHFGGALSQEQLLLLRGRRRQDCAAAVDAWLPAPVGSSALLAVQQPIVRALLPSAAAMPAAERLLQHCRDHRIPIALVTSSSEDAVRFKSEPHPWLAMLETRIYGDDPELRAGKPDPAPFLLAAERLSVQAERCWALEDSVAGTKSALAAGCCVWVLDQDADEDQSDQNPQRIRSLQTVVEKLVSTDG